MPEPILLSTWTFGQRANAAGWPHLTAATPSSLDAVEYACRASEADPHVMSVGLAVIPTDRARSPWTPPSCARRRNAARSATCDDTCTRFPSPGW